MENDVIELVVPIKIPDKNGFTNEEEKVMECMAEIRSAKRSEYYEAAREGTNVQLAAIINLDDMEAATITDESRRKKRPKKVRYDGVDYNIVREYRTSKTKVELTLQEVE